jgi:FKBP-type peptidyl-prolyl cis-trans isomerase
MKKHLLTATVFFTATFFFSLSSCDNSPHPGYSQVENDIFYKLHVAGESGKKAGPDDFYEVRMQNKFGGKVFFDSEFENARGTLLMQSAASRYFSVLGEGDSATFILPGGDLHLPGMPDTGTMEMNVKIERILSPDEVQKMEKSSDPDADEQILIHRYISRNKFDMKPDSAGIYYQPETEGTGAMPANGKTVTVTYTGMLFNNHIFDSSENLGGKFSFVWGTQDQLLPGILGALAHMKAGGKAKIILPSPLAFGVDGSSTGIVPPHTPVLYEIELISVE